MHDKAQDRELTSALFNLELTCNVANHIGLWLC